MMRLLADTQWGSFWLPLRGSTIAGEVDWLFDFIMAINIIFTLLIVGLILWMVIKYRERDGHAAQKTVAHSTALELTWTIIPTIIVLLIFFWGFQGYLRIAVAPPEPYEIIVNGKMWNWDFTYPNGHVDTELRVPRDTPVRVVLTSQDVIHSLYVPVFRLKKDAVPGRYNKYWFEASQTGTFDVFCTEYCGTNHSTMITRAVVHEPAEFVRWLEDASNWEKRMTPAEAGKLFVTQRGCVQCHSQDGSALIGPSFKNLFGSEHAFTDGTRQVADEDYISRSIKYPQEKIVAGYEPVMPSYLGSLKDRDIAAIIAYMKTISDNYKGDALPAGHPLQGAPGTASPGPDAPGDAAPGSPAGGAAAPPPAAH